jgi:hypothetical protein
VLNPGWLGRLCAGHYTNRWGCGSLLIYLKYVKSIKILKLSLYLTTTRYGAAPPYIRRVAIFKQLSLTSISNASEAWWVLAWFCMWWNIPMPVTSPRHTEDTNFKHVIGDRLQVFLSSTLTIWLNATDGICEQGCSERHCFHFIEWIVVWARSSVTQRNDSRRFFPSASFSK